VLGAFALNYDRKKVKGRKVHALVNVEGLPLHLIVHSVGIQDQMAQLSSSTRSASAFHGSNLSGSTPATTPAKQSRFGSRRSRLKK
jgi:hypothetical protein